MAEALFPEELKVAGDSKDGPDIAGDLIVDVGKDLIVDVGKDLVVDVGSLSCFCKKLSEDLASRLISSITEFKSDYNLGNVSSKQFYDEFIRYFPNDFHRSYISSINSDENGYLGPKDPENDHSNINRKEPNEHDPNEGLKEPGGGNKYPRFRTSRFFRKISLKGICKKKSKINKIRSSDEIYNNYNQGKID